MDKETRLAKARFKADLDLKKEMHKGNDGYTPVKGKDYWTPREVDEMYQAILSLIPKPKNGKDAVVDYEKILRYTYAKVAEHVAKIPTQKGDPGEPGKPGKDAVVDIDKIVQKVILTLPKQKDKKLVIDRESILKLIEERVSKIPSNQTVRVGGSVASIRALTDVNLDGVAQDAQGNFILGGNVATTIAGLLTAGDNVTITGSGTAADPFVVSTPAQTADMLKSVYDPQNIEADVFDRANQTGVQDIETVDGLQTILDSLIESGESVFFLENEADPSISSYKVMDNPAQLVAEASTTQSTIADGQIIESWVTDAGLPGVSFIPDGTWLFKVNAFKTGGTKEVRLYNDIYKRDVGGTETLLGTTSNSIILTTTSTSIPAFNIYIPAITLLETDRIVTKTRMRLIGGGSDPTSVTVVFSGSTAARLSIPSQAVDVTKFVRTAGDQSIEGVKTFASSPIIPAPTTDLQAATKKYVDDTSIPLSQKGSINGVAELDGAGHVPASQLPSYVDDVLEFANLAAFPVTGETGKIYVALDTNIVYRWSGSAYVEISASLALGETASTAYRGDRGKIAYDHTFLTDNPHGVTKTQVGLSNVDNTSDANKPVSTAQQTALNLKANLAGPTFTGTTTVDRLNYNRGVGTVSAIGNLGATETFDWATATHFSGNLDANITIDFSNRVSGQSITVYYTYSGAARTMAYTPTIVWLDNATGVAPTPPAASGNVLVVTYQDIGGTIYGSATGNYAVYA